MSDSDRARPPFLLRERVRWADVDHVQIMRFSAFPRLLELAEQEFLRHVGLPYSVVFHEPEIWMPRRRLEIDYLGPARIDDELELATWIGRVGERSFTLRVDVRHVAEDRPVAAMSLVIVCVSVADFRPVPLPEVWRRRAVEWQVAAERAM
ncbi:MAG: acyl-CoA thioesterase [Gemmatimonadaceae bacterium]|jgi:YbgC/YbaW family acyl-CoA thioester hydrolase|nr:acyl-CoA thioesterase [Gemmatimonadaceae bacterium]